MSEPPNPRDFFVYDHAAERPMERDPTGMLLCQRERRPYVAVYTAERVRRCSIVWDFTPCRAELAWEHGRRSLLAYLVTLEKAPTAVQVWPERGFVRGVSEPVAREVAAILLRGPRSEVSPKTKRQQDIERGRQFLQEMERQSEGDAGKETRWRG